MMASNTHGKSRSNQRGLAIVVVIVLLGILSVVLASNIRTLQNLKDQLGLIEKKQLKHHEPPQQEEGKKKND
jgi:hypothetical protein